jgi:hypothetical protein
MTALNMMLWQSQFFQCQRRISQDGGAYSLSLKCHDSRLKIIWSITCELVKHLHIQHLPHYRLGNTSNVSYIYGRLANGRQPMSEVEIIFSGRSFTIPSSTLSEDSSFFSLHPDVDSDSAYEVQAAVRPEIFDEFFSCLKKKEPFLITAESCRSLSILGLEFGHTQLCAQSSHFRLCALEAETSEVSDQLTHAGFPQMFHDIRSLKYEIRQIKSQPRSTIDDSIQRDVTSLKSEIQRLKAAGPRPAVENRSIVFKPATELNAGQPLNGIIADLTGKCGVPLETSGLVKVTASSVSNPRYSPANAADLTSGSYFYSKGQENQWICYEFCKATVRLKKYAIRSYWGDCHPKSWVVEISSDGSDWKEVDRQDGNKDLNAKNAVKSFSVRKAERFRFVRLRQIGKNHRGNDSLAISALEIFGSYTEL